LKTEGKLATFSIIRWWHLFTIQQFSFYLMVKHLQVYFNSC
jgi:hypothetical protein